MSRKADRGHRFLLVSRNICVIRDNAEVGMQARCKCRKAHHGSIQTCGSFPKSGDPDIDLNIL